MKVLAVFAGIFLSLFISTYAQAYLDLSPEEKVLHIEWSYDTSLPNLGGYRLYQDGVQIYEITPYSKLAGDYNVIIPMTGAVAYTLTAWDINGNESVQSEPYYVWPAQVRPDLFPAPAGLRLSET